MMIIVDQGRFFGVGILYFGFGSFYCVYQVVYMCGVFQVVDGLWGIIGVVLCLYMVVDVLYVQDLCYFVVIIVLDGILFSVLGVYMDVFVGVDELVCVVVYIVDVDICIIIFMVIENGYGYFFVIQYFDFDDDGICVDLCGEVFCMMIGQFVCGVQVCVVVGGVFLLILSCDNLVVNGKYIEKLVCEFLYELLDVEGVDVFVFFDCVVIFFFSMVDWIVFVIILELCMWVCVLFGVDDVIFVLVEFFLMWVIEDWFVGGCLVWDVVGVVFIMEVG